MNNIGAYDAALIGAVGAVIGGVLTAGSNLLIETTRRRADRRAARDRDSRELRKATRLVLEELSEIDRTIQDAAKTQLTWPSQDRQLPAFAWREYRGILATHVVDEAWRWVAAAYEEANSLNWRVIELERELDTTTAAHFADKEWLRQPLRAVRAAMEKLEEAIGPHGGAFAYTGYVSTEELEAALFDTPGSAETTVD
jgi:hypothetical protein